MKKFRWTKGSSFLAFLLVALFIFLGMMIGTGLRYSDIKSLRNQAAGLAGEIRGNSYQLVDYINRTQVRITPDLLSQFQLKGMEESFSEVQKEIKRIPPNKIRATEKMNQGMLLIRKAMVNYNLALKELSVKNYEGAKGQLKYAHYYAEKAESLIFDQSPVSFQFQKP